MDVQGTIYMPIANFLESVGHGGLCYIGRDVPGTYKATKLMDLRSNFLSVIAILPNPTRGISISLFSLTMGHFMIAAV
jgi:hypothetical protein